MNEQARQSLQKAKDYMTQEVMFQLIEAEKNGANISKANGLMYELIYELNNLIYNNGNE